MKNKKTVALVASLVALGLALTACSDTGSADVDASADHNEQDVKFATEMIPHHAQAVRMADLAADRSESQDVKDLAEEISSAQGPEIEQMSSWLEAWGEEVPDTSDTGGMDHGDMGDDPEDLPGMMSSDDLERMEAASGAEFDEMFLSMMIEHHQGAIEMAQVEQTEGEFPDAIELAETVEEAQTEEIQIMEELLAAS